MLVSSEIGDVWVTGLGLWEGLAGGDLRVCRTGSVVRALYFRKRWGSSSWDERWRKSALGAGGRWFETSLPCRSRRRRQVAPIRKVRESGLFTRA